MSRYIDADALINELTPLVKSASLRNRNIYSAVKRWLTKPYTDAAEYKMWGNGVALPCVYFIMSGIEWASSLPIEEPKPVEKAGQLSIFDF